MTQTAPTLILVVAEATVRCSNGDHDVRLLSDGRRFTAHTVLDTFTGPVERDGTRFTATCEGPGCPERGGTVTIDTAASEDTWRRAYHSDALLLDTYAQEVCEA